MRRAPLLLLAAIAVLTLCLLGSRATDAIGIGDRPDSPPAPAPPAAPPAAPTPGGPDQPAPEPTDPSPDPDRDHSDHDHSDHDHATHGVAEVTGVEEVDPDAVPEVLRVAEEFAQVWSTPDPDWPDRISSLATPSLAASLTEPPPREVAGGGTVLLDAPEWVRVAVPAEEGTLVLDVVWRADRWLVSALDWQPGEQR